MLEVLPVFCVVDILKDDSTSITLQESYRNFIKKRYIRIRYL